MRFKILVLISIVSFTFVMNGCKDPMSTNGSTVTIAPETIPQFGAILPPNAGKISTATWDKIMDACPEFKTVSSSAVRNPMTGDPVRMSGPHKFAEFIVNGEKTGLLFLRSNSGEMSFDGDGSEFKAAVAKAVGIIGGEIETYIE